MTVNFKFGLCSLEQKEGIKRHPEPARQVDSPNRPTSRKGKVSTTQWVDLMVRRTASTSSPDHDEEQYELVNEALNLLSEKYGKPPIG